MDKMQMAHDWYMKHSESPNFMYLEVEQAWQYADAMKAEADERSKAEAEQKRKEVREMLNAQNTFVEREGQHFDDVCGDEIQAQRDAELYGTGFLKVTYDSNGVKYERLNPKTISICSANMGLDSQVLKYWQPDWSQAPELAKWWSMDSSGKCYWFKNKPKMKSVTWMPINAAEVSRAQSFNYQGNWKDSLRERPE